MPTDRIPITVISGGYNYGWADKLVTEEWPRWRSERIRFTHEDSDVRMYIDYPHNITDPTIKPAKCSIAVVEEPYWVVPEFNHFIFHNYRSFDRVFTNQKSLLDMGHSNNIRYYPGSFCNIHPKNWAINSKSRLVCAIFSGKSYSEGHKMRQEVKSDAYFTHRVDFVNSVPFIENSYFDKWDLIHPYMYNIAIENTFGELWTEKLLDCFLTGCIPIYKGNDRIQNYFNMNGVMLFDTMEQLRWIVEWLSKHGEEYYHDNSHAIRENFETAQRFVNLGDSLWEHGLEYVLKEKGII